MRIFVLGVPIAAVTEHEALRHIASFFTREGQFHVATPNPEMLVEAERNPEFRKVLERTSLNLPDGMGLVWALQRRQKRQKGEERQKGQRTFLPSLPFLPFLPSSTSESTPIQRVTGTDTLLALCSLSARICPPERVFLLGAAPGIAERAAGELQRRNPLLKIVGTFGGSPRIEDEQAILQRINAAAPTLLCVAFGAPAQDLWIARNLPKMPCVKVAMGVGGALDFIAGKRKRAPQCLRKCGLEWLWRLMMEPRRIRRIWNAVVVFPWFVLTSPSPPPSSPE